MKVETRFFGEIEFREEDVINFTRGLLGFEDVKKYLIIDNLDGAGVFKWLQSVDRPELAFVIMNPFFIVPDYQFDIPDGLVKKLGIEKPEDVAVFTIVVVPEDINKMTTNLKAPIILNTRNNRAIQMVLDDDRYRIKHPVANPMRNVG